MTLSSTMYFRGHAYFDNFFYQFSASLFPLYEEEKTMWWKTWKNSNNNINTKRQAPWNFQNVCTILYLFITSLNPSTMGLLETDWWKFDRHHDSQIFIKRAWLSGQLIFKVFVFNVFIFSFLDTLVAGAAKKYGWRWKKA